MAAPKTITHNTGKSSIMDSRIILGASLLTVAAGGFAGGYFLGKRKAEQVAMEEQDVLVEQYKRMLEAERAKIGERSIASQIRSVVEERIPEAYTTEEDEYDEDNEDEYDEDDEDEKPEVTSNNLFVDGPPNPTREETMAFLKTLEGYGHDPENAPKITFNGREIEEDDELDVDTEGLEDWEVQALKSSIYIIPIEEWATDNRHEKFVMTYYAVDDVVTDETDEIQPSPEDFLGLDALANFGYLSDDKNAVYVRNENLGADYEVIRVNRSYQEDVMGIHPPKPQVSKMRYEEN